MAIKFKKNKLNNVEYINYNDTIIPIDKIVYIEKQSERVYDSVIPEIRYVIYYGMPKLKNTTDYYTNHKETKLVCNSITITEETYKYLERTILKNNTIKIKSKY